MMNILLIDGGLQGVSVTRSLKNDGYNVFALLSSTDLLNKYSQLNHAYITNYHFKDNEYIDLLFAILEKKNVSVIIPMSDNAAEFLSLNKTKIETHFETKCAIPEYSIFSKANDKWELLHLCEQHGLPHPRTRKITPDILKNVAEYVGFPSLIKPNISVGARGITMVNSMDELEQKYGQVIKQYGDSTLQEYIENGGAPYYNVMLYRDSFGKIVNSVVLEIIRYYPVKGGSSSFGKTIECEELVDICGKTLEILKWNGFADFDVLKDRNGEYKIIEINPRVPASLRAAEISGVNFPSLIVSELLDQPLKSCSYTKNKRLRYLGLDIMWFISSPNRLKAISSWLTFWSKDLYYQEKGVMMSSLISGLRKIFSSSFRKSKQGL